MRKSMFIAFSLILTTLVGVPARADEAQKIIDQYLKAVGGSKAVSRLQTLAIDGSGASIGHAAPGTYTFKAKRPNTFYTELRPYVHTLIDAYNDKSAWHHVADREIRTLLTH